MAIKHRFPSLVTDIGGATYVQPTHWNDAHNTPPFKVFSLDFVGAASLGIPSTAGPTGFEFTDNTSGGDRGTFDFTYVDTIQLGVGRASNANTGAVAAGSVAARYQYMASGFPGSWYSFDATGGSAPFVSLATAANASQYLASANGLMFSASVTVSAAAKAQPMPLNTRVAGYGGNGSAVFLTKIVVYGS